MPYPLPSFTGNDPQKFTVTRENISGGANSRQHAKHIRDDQVESLSNVDIAVPGLTRKRAGRDLIEKLGTDPGTGAFAFNPIGESDRLIVTHGTKLEDWTGSGTFTENAQTFTDGLLTTFCKATTSTGDSVMLVCNGTDSFYEFTGDDLTATELTGADGPTKTQVFVFYRNRVWTLKDEQLDYSDAAPASYDGTFQNTKYTIPVGTEVAIVGIRDQGLFMVGSDAVYALNPSAVPSANDKPEPILDIGGVGTKTFIQVGDDIMGLFYDGIRAIKRTAQDKLQLGVSYPLSYVLRDEVDSINWAAASKASAVWFDNKYIIALPVDGATYNNQVWVYNPASNGWTIYDDWNVADWAKFKIDNTEGLYGIDSVNGAVYQYFAGTTDDDDSGDATAITYTETGRKEDLGAPYNKKNTGELTIRAESSGGTITVEGQFDDDGWNTLGTMAITGNSVNFASWTLPFLFKPSSIITKKFHLDSYGGWYTFQYRLTHSGENDCKILERTIRAYTDEYTDEESE